MMTFDEFQQAQEHNSQIINNILTTGKTAGLENIIFWEKPKKVSFDITLSKGFDILGCCAIGAIPSIRHSGADGFAYFNEYQGPQEIETKVSTVDSDCVQKGARGGLSVKTMYQISKPTGITSFLCGRFNPYMSDETFKTKGRHTALVCFDRKHNQIIDAWMMDPDTVLQQLSSADLSSQSLSLARFLVHGWNIPTPVTKIGWNDWQEQF